MTTSARSAFSLPLVSSVAENAELAELGEQLGFDDVWLADTGSIDVFVLAAMAGSAATRSRIGTAVVPAFTRPPALLAAAAASVSQVVAPIVSSGDSVVAGHRRGLVWGAVRTSGDPSPRDRGCDSGHTVGAEGRVVRKDSKCQELSAECATGR